jgi:hypothetical protein
LPSWVRCPGYPHKPLAMRQMIDVSGGHQRAAAQWRQRRDIGDGFDGPRERRCHW